VVVSGGDGGGGVGTYLGRWWERGSSSLMVVRGLRVVSWGCGGLFPTCAAGVIYFLNNPHFYAQLAQLVGASLYSHRPKGYGFDSHCGQLFFKLNI
jgi:hypothetical protein